VSKLIEFQKAAQRIYNILLVEDDPHLLKAVNDFLEDQNFQVTAAKSGESAIEALNKKAFDLVITDLIMNKVSGIIVLKKVKELNRETMVIIMTGNRDIDFAIEALRLDVNDYILKPFKLDDFLDRVIHCLAKQESIRRNRGPIEA